MLFGKIRMEIYVNDNWLKINCEIRMEISVNYNRLKINCEVFNMFHLTGIFNSAQVSDLYGPL